MEDQSYKIVLEGRLRDGIKRPLAIKKLSILLKRDVEAVAELLSGRPTVMAQGLDYRSALKFQSLIGSVGALSRIEPETRAPEPSTTVEQPAELSVEPPPEDHPQAALIDRTSCPRCGYHATRDDDVLVVRGDCPRCGLRIAAPLYLEDQPEPSGERLLMGAFSELPDRAEVPLIYGDRTPASWKRRALASLHTFSLFLAVYCTLATLSVFSFLPLESVPGSAGRGILHAVFISFPILLPALSIILVSFVLPIFNNGLSWGQSVGRIVILYTEEAQVGGLYLSLAFRVAAIGLVSFAPGLIVLWLVSRLDIVTSAITETAIMIVMAILGWLASWVYLERNSEKLGILDRAGGTIQTEEEPMPEGAVKKTLAPIGMVAGLSVVLGLIVPLCLRALR